MIKRFTSVIVAAAVLAGSGFVGTAPTQATDQYTPDDSVALSDGAAQFESDDAVTSPEVADESLPSPSDDQISQLEVFPEPVIDTTIPHVIGSQSLLASLAPFSASLLSAAALPNKTIAQLNTWVNNSVGTCFTHPQAGGCKALFARYSQDFLGHPGVVSGNAKDLYAAAAPGTVYNTYWSRFITGSTPQKGDVAIWGGTVGGGLGHVALVLGNVSSTKLRVYHQNWNGTCAHKEEVSKTGIIGYLRPRNLS